MELPGDYKSEYFADNINNAFLAFLASVVAALCAIAAPGLMALAIYGVVQAF